MNHFIEKPGFLARLWQGWLETSEVAVAVHYREPWAAMPAVEAAKAPVSVGVSAGEALRAGWQDCRL